MYDPISPIEVGSGADLAALERLAPGVEGFYKALTAGAGTDHATLSGGAALRRESIEASVMVITQRMKHFVLYNKLAKSPATATIDEWTVQDGIGGIPGSTAIGEDQDIPENTGSYNRKVGQVKFLKDRRRVTVEAEIQSANGLASAIAKETDAGTLKLLTDANYLGYYGNLACNPAEFDGLVALLEALGGDHVLDLRGNDISSDAREWIDSARLIWDQGNWGMATDCFVSPRTKASLNLKLDPAHRVILNNQAQQVTKGANVRAIETGFGEESPLLVNTDPFIQESGPPYVVRGGNFAAQLGTSLTSVVSTIAGVAGANANSKFQAAHAGNYYYAVEAGRQQGRSALVKSAQVAVAAGDRVVVTITPPNPNNATYYAIYRGRKNGTNADADFREIARIPANGITAVTYNDDNQNIPGTSIAVVLTLLEDAITIRRMLPQMRFPLYPSTKAEYTWAQLLFLYLRVAKINQHRLIKNILPAAAAAEWSPF